MIPYGRHEVTDEDITAINRVLKNQNLTQGEEAFNFEKKVANYVGANFACAVNSATSALFVACKALGLAEADIAWTVPTTFVASANVILHCGAEIDFVDIDPLTLNISPQALEKKLETANLHGRLPKLIIVVHMAGRSCEMSAIHAICKKYHVKVIEDASHALGAKCENRYVGNCAYSDITVFSFHPVKIITTCEGGMAVSNQKTLIDKMKLVSQHGITRDNALWQHKSDLPWYYEQHELGWNFRMSDVQAVLGISQLERVEKYIQKRNDIAKYYQHELNGTKIELPIIEKQKNRSAFHLYIILFPNQEIQKNVANGLIEKGIVVNHHYMPVHMQPYYKKLGFKENMFPNAEKYSERGLSIPIFPALSETDQQYVIDHLKILTQ
jgi:UDP-4-amino-4,6-dideoxy-N-acetyl-beta-L-altrosamine transaminase